MLRALRAAGLGEDAVAHIARLMDAHGDASFDCGTEWAINYAAAVPADVPHPPH